MIGEAPAASGGAAGAATNLKHFRQAMTRAVLWPLAAMFALAAAFLALIVLLLNTANWVDHTDQVIAQIHVVEARLIDRETGLRGYLLTGNSEFLEPYTAATAALPPALDRLATLVADNPAQLGRLDAIAAERRAWEQFAQEAMLRYERGGDYEAYVSAGIGKRRMDAMRELLAGMVRAEASLRENRMAATDRMTWLVIGGSITQAALLGAFLAWATRRQILTLAQQYGAALAASARGAARLQTLHQIDRAILTRASLAETVRDTLQRLAALVDAPRAVALLDPPAQRERLRLVVGAGGAQTEALPRTPDGLDGLFPTAAWPQPVLVDLAAIRHAPLLAEPLASAQVPQMLLAPLCSNGGLCGVLALGLPERLALDADTRVLLREVTDQLTIALDQERLRLDNARHTAELEERVAARTAQLEEANGELEAFGYSVAHDLRAPVRAMQGFAAILQEDYRDQLDALGQEYAERIVSAGAQMDELISDLLAYSRLSRAELSFGPVSLRQALDDALALLAEEIALRGATITVNEPLPSARGHRTTLAQVLANLLANAMTFVAPGLRPEVVVRASARDGWVRLEVRDNGIGIEPAHQERIFRVFERLHSAEQYRGTGIGLAIVRKGVERMGGRAGVESAPGAGSVFWIELPQAEGYA
jgi:signal transduction histidine kinase/CHASE3 domain sensor protein